MIAVREHPAGERFRLGMVTGFVHYLTLIYWLTTAMLTYGGMPWYAGIGVLCLFVIYLALYMGIFATLLSALTRTSFRFLAGVPLLWVALEFVRAKALTGFPWELLGYSQYRALRIIQISDIFGIYGVSFLIASVNAGAFLIWLFLNKERLHQRTVTWKTAGMALLGSVLLVCLTLTYGGWRMRMIRSVMASAPHVRAAVVQGDIAQDVKWDPAFKNATTETYLRLSREAAIKATDLVVWPETATPFYLFRDTQLTRRIQEGVKASGAFFVVGSPSVEFSGNELHYYNSAFLMNPDGALSGKYDKVHLVPFGEYVPCQKLLPFVGKLVEAVGDFSAGHSSTAIPWAHGRIGVQICYEIVFPSLSRHAVENQADLLVNITNDAWYGKSSAPYQHFSMAVLRAVENRRSVVRAANTGISGFVDPVGRIVAQTPLFEEATLTRSVPVMEIKTFYTRWGDWFPVGCGIWIVLIFLTDPVNTKRIRLEVGNLVKSRKKAFIK